MSTPAQANQATADAARAIRDAARSHHRSASFHRRESQRLMVVFDRMREELAQHGITLVVEDVTER